MDSLRSRLGSLTALVTFEAAARLNSFTQAAEELGVSQVAVSKQIRALETDLRLRLFIRRPRGVELTPEGVQLVSVVSQSLNFVADTVTSLRRPASKKRVTIAATLAMSHFWLLPRLVAFRKSHPTINVRLVSQDADVALQPGGADLAIRFGDGKWRDGRAQKLFTGEIYPLASPSYLNDRPPIRAPDDLRRETLIGYDKIGPSWVDWSDWFAACGVPHQNVSAQLQCTRYVDAINAALLDQGVVLGWKGGTLDVEITQKLVRLTNVTLRTGHSFFLVRRDGHSASSIEAVATFLCAAAIDTDASTADLINGGRVIDIA